MSYMEGAIGIIGGGQLGKMLIQEGKKLGLKFNILDPSVNCPAASIADKHIVGSFYDGRKLQELAEVSEIITYEFEHIDADLLVTLMASGHKIYPSPLTLKLIQDKYLQKLFLKENNIPTPDFTAINSLEELYKAGMSFGYPMLLKLRKGGYDGKGNYIVGSEGEVEEAYVALGGGQKPLMAEAFVNYRMEISAIVARGTNRQQEVYPLSENQHNNNILRTTIVPARLTDEAAVKGREIALKTLAFLEGIGVFCIEMFVDAEDNVFVNEIAPRTHNSGHYSIEGCYTSQFAQHLRCILGLPLGSSQLIHPSVMINLLGEEKNEGRARLVGVEEALAIKGLYLHFYGKAETKPFRKMGHITIVDNCLQEALRKTAYITDKVKVLGEKGGETHE